MNGEWKKVAEMTTDEAMVEAEHLVRYMEQCREIGQGVNTKETVRFNRCLARLKAERPEEAAFIADMEIRWNPALAEFRDLLVMCAKNNVNMEQMRQMFEPV